MGWGDDEGEEGEGVTVGNTVGFGEVGPVGPGPMVALVVFESPINVPGPISGPSKRCTREGAKENTKIRISYHQYPSP